MITENLQDYDLTIEASSTQALHFIQNKHYDIFIVDFQMPVMDGIALLEKIKQEYTDKKYVAILCTAYGTVHLFKRELVQGLFTFFLEKPFETTSLKQVVMKAVVTLEKRRAGVKYPFAV